MRKSEESLSLNPKRKQISANKFAPNELIAIISGQQKHRVKKQVICAILLFSISPRPARGARLSGLFIRPASRMAGVLPLIHSVGQSAAGRAAGCTA